MKRGDRVADSTSERRGNVIATSPCGVYAAVRWDSGNATTVRQARLTKLCAACDQPVVSDG